MAERNEKVEIKPFSPGVCDFAPRTKKENENYDPIALLGGRQAQWQLGEEKGRLVSVDIRYADGKEGRVMFGPPPTRCGFIDLKDALHVLEQTREQSVADATKLYGQQKGEAFGKQMDQMAANIRNLLQKQNRNENSGPPVG